MKKTSTILLTSVIASVIFTIAQPLNAGEIKTTDETKQESRKAQRFIEIVQTDADGNNISLAEVVKGNKYVLIDFWASWCGPCLNEIPYLIDAYDQYADKGFEIYGVSLDYQKSSWINTVQKRGMKWIHVSDLEFWKNAAAVKYGIRAIPANFLVDDNGIIIATNLRGESLKKKLSELLD